MIDIRLLILYRKLTDYEADDCKGQYGDHNPNNYIQDGVSSRFRSFLVTLTEDIAKTTNDQHDY